MQTLDIELGPNLTAEEAERIVDLGREATIFALLELAGRLKAQQGPPQPGPATPSGMIAPFQKATVPHSKRRRRPGAKPGHLGRRRAKPERVDRTVEHRATACPACGGPLAQCQETRERYIEDLPDDLKPQVTRHVIHRDWCATCRKRVEPRVPEALPNCTLGNRVVVLSAFLHFCLGNTLGQIVDVFNFHLTLKLTPGGLIQMWHRLAELLYPWYEQLQREALGSAVLHADESGWRVNGRTHWLWCFANDKLTYYMIDRCRGGPALEKFFVTEFGGVLVSDFWGAYNSVVCALRQTCLVHLLRDLEHVEKYKSTAGDWADFAKKLRRLIADAIRLWKRSPDVSAEAYASRRARLTDRLLALIDEPWTNTEVKRLLKRLRRHQHDLFTFLDQPGVPFENNLAERAIRPAVIIRKNSYGNRSDQGADTQAILMSIFRTLKQRQLDPLEVVINAIRNYLTTGNLPPFPTMTTSDG